MLLGSNYILSDGIRGLGHPLIPSAAEVIGVIVTVAGLIILLPRYGLTGAASASIISYAATLFVLLAGIRKVTKLTRASSPS